jgi:hypothetical protein
VGYPDFPDREALLLDDLDDLVDVTTRIDDHRVLRLGIEEDRTILLERSDRNNACLELPHDASLIDWKTIQV